MGSLERRLTGWDLVRCGIWMPALTTQVMYLAHMEKEEDQVVGVELLPSSIYLSQAELEMEERQMKLEKWKLRLP